MAYADYFGRPALGTIRGITEPFTTLGQAIGVLIPGLIFDFVGGASYLPFFFGAGFVGGACGGGFVVCGTKPTS